MSRWIQDFENHAFQANWGEAKTLVYGISISSGASEPELKEYARLKKVVIYIDDLIDSADPELIPLSVWNNFTSQCNNIKSQINHFRNNNNFSHLNSANTYLDNLLTYISPYVRNGKSSAQAAGRAFKLYSDLITVQIEKLENTANSAVANTQEVDQKSKAILTEIESKKEKIDELEELLLIGSEDKPSLKMRMDNFESETRNSHDAVFDFFQKLTTGNEEESSIVFQIDEAKTKAIENSEKTQSALDNSNMVIRELSTFGDEVLGKENDDGDRSGGLKLEFDKMNEEFAKFQIQHKTNYSTLKAEIESLLPGATSAGLATAYKTMKDSYKNPIKNTTRMFYGALVGLLIVGLILVTKKIGLFYIEFVEIDTATKLLNNIIFKLPITIPLVWMALFASKRRSQNMRLEQEYAHKEALAKSYQGFKKQIEDLGSDKSDALIQQLLQAAIESVSFNASGTLEGKHADKFPIVDDMNGLIKLVKVAKEK